MSAGKDFRYEQKLGVKCKSLPVGLIACEARGAVGHTFSPVDDKVNFTGKLHPRAHVHGDATPAFKFVRARGTVWHTVTLVVVVEAGGAGRRAARFSAASQTLAVATLPLVCAGLFAVVWTDWRRQRKMGERSAAGVNTAGRDPNKSKAELGQSRR